MNIQSSLTHNLRNDINHTIFIVCFLNGMILVRLFCKIIGRLLYLQDLDIKIWVFCTKEEIFVILSADWRISMRSLEMVVSFSTRAWRKVSTSSVSDWILYSNDDESSLKMMSCIVNKYAIGSLKERNHLVKAGWIGKY